MHKQFIRVRRSHVTTIKPPRRPRRYQDACPEYFAGVDRITPSPLSKAVKQNGDWIVKSRPEGAVDLTRTLSQAWITHSEVGVYSTTNSLGCGCVTSRQPR